MKGFAALTAVVAVLGILTIAFFVSASDPVGAEPVGTGPSSSSSPIPCDLSVLANMPLNSPGAGEVVSNCYALASNGFCDGTTCVVQNYGGWGAGNCNSNKGTFNNPDCKAIKHNVCSGWGVCSIGGGSGAEGDECTNNNDCKQYSYMCDAQGQCNPSLGMGDWNCNPAEPGACDYTYHICVPPIGSGKTEQCPGEKGIGPQECTTPADCQKAMHNECVGTECIQVPGKSSDVCMTPMGPVPCPDQCKVKADCNKPPVLHCVMKGSMDGGRAMCQYTGTRITDGICSGTDVNGHTISASAGDACSMNWPHGGDENGSDGN